MSILSEITRLSGAKSDIADAIEYKGVTVPDSTKLDGYAALIRQIQGGGVTVVETTDENGGTVVEITSTTDPIRFQEKSATPTTSSQTVSPDTGYNGLSRVVVNPIPSQYIIPTGTRTITENGTGINVAQYAAVDVSVPTGADCPTFTATWVGSSVQSVTCDKTYSECRTYDNYGVYFALLIETSGSGDFLYDAVVSASVENSITYTTFSADGPLYDITYASDGTITPTQPSQYAKTLSTTTNGTYHPSPGVYTEVNVNVPTGTARTSADLTVSGATVTVPAGLYASDASASVASGTAGTPTATMGAVSDHTVTVTPSVTNTTGYITGGTISGTGIHVSVYDLASGTQSIAENGMGIDVAEYAYVDVSVPPTDFVVTFSYNSQTEMWEPDCTYSQLDNARDSGKNIYGVLYGGNDAYRFCNIYYNPSDMYYVYAVYSYNDEHFWTYELASDGSIETVNDTDVIEPWFQTVTKTYTPTESTQTETVTFDTSQYYNGLQEVDITVNPISPTYVGSGITRRTSSNLAVNGAMVTAPSGYYSANASAFVASGTTGTPTATKGAVSNHSMAVTPSVTNTTGYITGGTLTGTAVTVSASELVSGTKSISANGTGIDVTNYAEVDVSVTPSLEAKTGITPTESSQTISPSTGYDGLSSVQIDAVSSTYVGSGITRRSSTDLTASGATVSVPAGYYSSAASKSVSSGSATTPATTVTANPSISVNSSTGLITATASATKSVTPTVSAGYVSSGTAGTITVSGSNTSQLSTQAATTITPTKSSQTAVTAGKYTTGAVTVAAIPAAYQDVTGVTATASDVVSGKDFVNSSGTLVNGSLVIQNYYTGSTAPSSSLGANGDIYLDTTGSGSGGGGGGLEVISFRIYLSNTSNYLKVIAREGNGSFNWHTLTTNTSTSYNIDGTSSGGNLFITSSSSVHKPTLSSSSTGATTVYGNNTFLQLNVTDGAVVVIIDNDMS